MLVGEYSSKITASTASTTGTTSTSPCDPPTSASAGTLRCNSERGRGVSCRHHTPSFCRRLRCKGTLRTHFQPQLVQAEEPSGAETLAGCGTRGTLPDSQSPRGLLFAAKTTTAGASSTRSGGEGRMCPPARRTSTTSASRVGRWVGGLGPSTCRQTCLRGP